MQLLASAVVSCRRRGAAALAISLAVLASGALTESPATLAAGTPLEATPAILDFGDVDIGSSDTLDVHITNTGAQPYGPIQSSGGAVTSPFIGITDCIGVTLAPGDHCTLTFTFAPNAVGSFTATSTTTYTLVADPAQTEDFTITLEGNGFAPPSTTVPGPECTPWDPSMVLVDFADLGEPGPVAIFDVMEDLTDVCYFNVDVTQVALDEHDVAVDIVALGGSGKLGLMNIFAGGGHAENLWKDFDPCRTRMTAVVYGDQVAPVTLADEIFYGPDCPLIVDPVTTTGPDAPASSEPGPPATSTPDPSVTAAPDVDAAPPTATGAVPETAGGLPQTGAGVTAIAVWAGVLVASGAAVAGAAARRRLHHD